MKNTFVDIIKGIVKKKNTFLYKQQIIQQYNDEATIPLDIQLEYNANRKLGFERYLCNAPYVSLYFGLKGEVTVCCLNRTHILGNVANDTISNLWNSNKLEELRKSISHQTLHLGCEHCKNQLLAKNFTNLVANEYDGYDTQTTDFPKVITFETSNICNLACVFCSGTFSSTFNKKYENLPEENIYTKDFFEEIKLFLLHTQKVNFLGGEPLLIPEYIELIEYIVQHNPSCDIHLQTNGHVFNNRVKNLLDKGRFHIGISIESVEEKKFESIRQFGNWKKLMSNIENFKAYAKKNRLPINLAVTPIQSSVQELVAIYEFACHHQFELFFNVLYSPYDHALWSADCQFLENTIVDLEKKTSEIKARSSLQKRNLESLKAFYQLLVNWQENAKKRALIYTYKNNVDEYIAVVMQRITAYLNYTQQFSAGKNQELIEKLNNKLTHKAKENPELYHTKIYHLLQMPDDVIFGCISHVSF